MRRPPPSTPARGTATGRTTSRSPGAAPQEDIALPLVEATPSGAVDLAMGGERRHVLPASATDAEGSAGMHADGRDPAQEIGDDSGACVRASQEYEAMTAPGAAPPRGVFVPSHMRHEADRDGGQSLAQMSAAAIMALSTNEEGCRPRIGAGRVDHAIRDGNLHRTRRMPRPSRMR